MVTVFSVRAQAPVPPLPSDDAIRQILRQRIDEKKRGVGIVVGVIDEHGSRVVSYGRTERGGGKLVDGRTMFEIGSVTKVFTSLLLALAVERGEVKLDDPVAKLLPPEAKMPTRNGKQITLLDLATHRSGLPRMPANFAPKDPEDPYADYTPAQMYAFLSGYPLTRDPGAEFEYSNLGAGLLGDALARRAGKSYENLVSERICVPLGMGSTVIAMFKEAQVRQAAPYKEDLTPAKFWYLPTLAGAGALRSDAEDMLKFLSAEMGVTQTLFASAMTMTQISRSSPESAMRDIGLAWHIEHPRGGALLWHNGGTGGFRSFIGFNPQSHRGVVVLSNTANSVDDIGFDLIRSPETRVAVAIKPEVADQYVGRYKLAPDFVLTFSRTGDHYYLQATGQGKNEVFPETDTDFFLKVVDAQISFVKDPAGNISALVLHQGGDQMAKRLP